MAGNKKIALRKLSRSETARRDVVNIRMCAAHIIAIFVVSYAAMNMQRVQARSRGVMHIHDC